MRKYLSLSSLYIEYHQGDFNKRPFIFVHGNTQNDTCGEGIKDYFRQRGHTILSYDLPGHGKSKLDTSDYIFADLIDLNQQILKHYKLTRPILCGHSLGGMIQAGTIARYKWIESSLILCGSYDSNPVLKSTKKQKNNLNKILAEYIFEGKALFQEQFKYDYFKNRQVLDDDLKIINRQYTQPEANEANLKSLGNFSARETLIKMRIPILVLHGEEETVIPKVMVTEMASEYEQMELAWYSGKGHYAFYQDSELTNVYLDKYYSFLT